jgi:signal transduction histidine kinase
VGQPLRVLMVEDTPEDAELVLRALKKGDFEPSWIRVETKEAFQAALAQEKWALILADFSLPKFSAVEAFAIVKELGIDVPFVIVSGTVGEEAAVSVMRAGVHDFVLKDRLQRLVPVVERELREAAVRSERVKMREQLMASDRMASVGMLAASVVHEINNPLAAILANLDLAVEHMSHLDTSKLGEIPAQLKDAHDAAQRLRSVTSDLRTFSRAPEGHVGPVDVRRVLDSSLRIAGNQVRHKARVITDFAEVPLVIANESHLGQVFLNLIVNAAHAIEEGQVERHRINVSTRSAGERVVIEIADTGSGMPPEVLRQLFTPFFTTKDRGVGTGLGLTICRRLVTEAKGEITVESEVGKGTTFRVSLPASRSTLPIEEIERSKPKASGRRGRILVVDDEQMILTVVSRTLADHDVVTTKDGREAVARIKAGERFDLILSDLMMPELDGVELHRMIAAAVPEQAKRIVFLSGGAFSEKIQEVLATLPNRQLQKPFLPADLRAVVEEQLVSS